MEYLFLFFCFLSLYLTIKKDWIGFVFGVVGNFGLFLCGINQNSLLTSIVLCTYTVSCSYGAYNWKKSIDK